MIYNILNDYRVYLEDFLRHETARTYHNRLEFLLNGQDIINTMENLDISIILNNLSKIKYKNNFSQAKNAFFYFLKFQNISLSDEQLKIVKQMQDNTRKKYKRIESINFNDIDKKIKHLRNKKLKLSYQTMLKTGLRVFELAQIRPCDTLISDDLICLYFTGKGGNKEDVSIVKKDNMPLYNDLLELINSTKQDHKVFYSAIYLQKEAKTLGFKCHDLRRIFAKIEYKKTKSKNEVRKKLRHSNIINTDIYLKSKINL